MCSASAGNSVEQSTSFTKYQVLAASDTTANMISMIPSMTTTRVHPATYPAIISCRSAPFPTHKRPSIVLFPIDKPLQRHARRVPCSKATVPDDGIVARPPQNPSPTLINDDFTPTTRDMRSFGWLDLASLWVGLVVCIPTYMLASGLVDIGFSATQAIATIFISNVITLVPMVLNAIPGTKYGYVAAAVLLSHAMRQYTLSTSIW